MYMHRKTLGESSWFLALDAREARLRNTCSSLRKASFQGCFQVRQPAVFDSWVHSLHLWKWSCAYKTVGPIRNSDGLATVGTCGHRGYLWAPLGCTWKLCGVCVQKPANLCLIFHLPETEKGSMAEQQSMNVLWHLRAIKDPLKITKFSSYDSHLQSFHECPTHCSYLKGLS